MTRVLLVGGPRHGEIETWPRPDEAPCIFPTETGVTDPYFRNKIVDYRVAFCSYIFLYPENILDCLNALDCLSVDESNLIRDENGGEEEYYLNRSQTLG